MGVKGAGWKRGEGSEKAKGRRKGNGKGTGGKVAGWKTGDGSEKGKETELERAEGGREGGHCKQGTTNEGGLVTSHTY